MNGSDLIWAIIKSWPFILFLLTLAFHAGGTIYMLLQHGRDIRKLQESQEKQKEVLERELLELKENTNKRLYQNNGQSIYVPGPRCGEIRQECKEVREREYNHLANSIREHGDKVDKLYRIMLALVKKRRSSNGG